MAQDFSFDVVSQFDRQELVNAVDQAQRELTNRFDFKGTQPELTLEDKAVLIEGDSEFHVNQIADVLYSRAAARKISRKIFKPLKMEEASKGRARQRLELQVGIPEELAKDLAKRIKGISPKVQTQIQGDQLRVSSRDKDLLQQVITALRDLDLAVPLQFTNYR